MSRQQFDATSPMSGAALARRPATSSPPRVALVGAYDRFNYGDLLFPLITSRVLAELLPEPEVAVYALRQSDLSAFGAMPTQPIRRLFDGSFLRDGDVCLVNGGGVLGVDWIYIYANTLGPLGNKVLRRAGRVLGQARLDRCIRWSFRGRSCAPFVIQGADFGQRVKVAYNAVGGGAEVQALPAARRSAVLASLARSDFMSVRDDDTMDVLAGVVPAVLAPDSAILMSRYFPLAQLGRLTGPADRRPGEQPYMCFQANADFGELHADSIVAMLEGAHAATGLPALLLPIGRYTGLDDHQFLVALSRRLRTPHRIFSCEATVEEIMGAIAHASLFLGTSLHGQVTSQSFAVPHLALGLKNPKLVSYVRSWAIPESSRCLEPADTAAAMAAMHKVLAVPQAIRQAHRDTLISQAQANFQRLFQAVGLLPAPGGDRQA